MMVLVVLAAVVAGLAVAWELRFVALWLLVRVVDASEDADASGRRSYADFRAVVADRGLAGLDIAWLSDDVPDVTDRADWQLRGA
ncbi:hypothetical protein [Actinomycetospora flava]|uniref:Uncharacterized protein n=1 Tax=Actinomycetospora flava TaxID=3129232 RepID=A0ABU8M8K5_9PSEU